MASVLVLSAQGKLVAEAQVSKFCRVSDCQVAE